MSVTQCECDEVTHLVQTKKALTSSKWSTRTTQVRSMQTATFGACACVCVCVCVFIVRAFCKYE